MNTSPIAIDVETRYIAEESDPELPRYVFTYHITLRNHGDEPAQLISRHWIITDANAEQQEVKGLGVVGEQPRLAPGEAYDYTSGVVLTTEVGTMEGSYQMVTDSGQQFEAPIPAFTLAIPRVMH